jgi:hypothetical protein
VDLVGCCDEPSCSGDMELLVQLRTFGVGHKQGRGGVVTCLRRSSR